MPINVYIYLTMKIEECKCNKTVDSIISLNSMEMYSCAFKETAD